MTHTQVNEDITLKLYPEQLAREMVHAWICDHAPIGAKLALGPADIHPLIQSIAAALRKFGDEKLEEAIHAVVCTPKFPLSDHDAHIRAIDAIRALKEKPPA